MKYSVISIRGLQLRATLKLLKILVLCLPVWDLSLAALLVGLVNEILVLAVEVDSGAVVREG